MANNQLSAQESSGFFRNMELLLHAGLPLADSLYLMAKEDTARAGDYTRLGEILDEGRPLSAAMAECGIFPLCAVGMVQVGEQAGRIEEALHMLASYYEARHQTAAHLRSTLTYPAVLMAVMLAVITLLLVSVLPVFAQVYASLGSQLTGISAALLHFGQLLSAALPALLALVAAVLLAAAAVTRIPAAREKAASVWQRRWGDRGVFRKFNNALFAQALAMGFGSGLPLTDAMDLAAQLLADRPGAARRIALCISRIAEGASLSDALAEGALLSASACRMLAVGLRGGNGAQVMEQLAHQTMEEAQTALERTVSRIEPVIVLICSVLVGAILLCVMLPLMNILSAIG